MDNNHIYDKIATVNFNNYAQPCAEEISYEVSRSKKSILEQSFPICFRGNEHTYFTWIWSTCATFAHANYNAVEIAYYLNVSPYTVACFIRHYGVTWAVPLLERCLAREDRGLYSVWQAGSSYVSIKLLKDRVGNKPATSDQIPMIRSLNKHSVKGLQEAEFSVLKALNGKRFSDVFGKGMKRPLSNSRVDTGAAAWVIIDRNFTTRISPEERIQRGVLNR